MAGSYADPVGPKLQYDRDGTIMIQYTGALYTSPVVIANSNLQAMVSPLDAAYPLGQNGQMGILFPALRDITHICMHDSTGSGFTAGAGAQWSPNTTNGVDGTWNNITASSGSMSVGSSNANLTSRTASPGVVSLTGVKGLRFTGSGSLGVGVNVLMLELFGQPSATSDRLEFWHPTLNQSLNLSPAQFDFGDVPRGSSAIVRQMRVKNMSGSLTASSITISFDGLSSDASPTVASQTEFSYNGGAYGSTASISSLAPGAISNLVSVRLTPSASAALSTWQQRYLAIASTWT